MSVKYICRHCRSTIGEIEEERVNELRLGFHSLTPEEHRDIISYRHDGAVIVSMTCDYCHEAIVSHPELAMQSNPLQ